MNSTFVRDQPDPDHRASASGKQNRGDRERYTGEREEDQGARNAATAPITSDHGASFRALRKVSSIVTTDSANNAMPISPTTRNSNAPEESMTRSTNAAISTATPINNERSQREEIVNGAIPTTQNSGTETNVWAHPRLGLGQGFFAGVN
jgi:hypothetical protein